MGKRGSDSSAIHGVLIIDGQKLEWRATISKMSTPFNETKMRWHSFAERRR